MLISNGRAWQRGLLPALALLGTVFAARAGGVDGARFVPDYVGVVDQYVDPAKGREADYGIGGSLIAGYRLDQQIAAEVRAFAAGLRRQRDGTPYLLGVGGDLKATGRYGFFVSGGGGIEHGSADDSHRTSPYLEIGGGWEHRLLPDLSLRLEASYRLLSNAGIDQGHAGGFGGELWAGAGVVVDLPGSRRHAAIDARPPPEVAVVPVRCPPAPEGFETDANGVLVAQDSRVVAIGFATASAAIDAAAQVQIGQLAAALRCGTAQQLAVQVVGHADARGGAVYNVQLSQRRAAAVRDALVAEGVDADRIGIEGDGKYEPLIKGNRPDINPANRRIQIKLYPGVTP